MQTIIIAEAGVNHNGSLNIAKTMIEQAKEAGADYIKFQTFKSNNLVTTQAKKASYQIRKINDNETQLDMLKKLELTQSDFIELNNYCNICDIGFLSTPFDMESVIFLEKLQMDYWKIPSGEVTDYPYLLSIAKTDLPILLSTGMCTKEEIQAAIKVLNQNKQKSITLLQCNTQYPTPYEDANLLAMVEMNKEFRLPIGYSDHTMGIEIPIAATALGAKIIEKHFTLDQTMYGPDHKASINPKQLKDMITSIRAVEKALGNAKKVPTSSEKDNISVVRKSIVAKREILKGEKFTDENITTKRPGNGLSPMLWNQIIGTCASRTFKQDEMIEII